jgi:hypothetical protein
VFDNPDVLGDSSFDGSEESASGVGRFLDDMEELPKHVFLHVVIVAASVNVIQHFVGISISFRLMSNLATAANQFATTGASMDLKGLATISDILDDMSERTLLLREETNSFVDPSVDFNMSSTDDFNDPVVVSPLFSPGHVTGTHFPDSMQGSKSTGSFAIGFEIALDESLTFTTDDYSNFMAFVFLASMIDGCGVLPDLILLCHSYLVLDVSDLFVDPVGDVSLHMCGLDDGHNSVEQHFSESVAHLLPHEPVPHGLDIIIIYTLISDVFAVHNSDASLTNVDSVSLAAILENLNKMLVAVPPLFLDQLGGVPELSSKICFPPSTFDSGNPKNIKNFLDDYSPQTEVFDLEYRIVDTFKIDVSRTFDADMLAVPQIASARFTNIDSISLALNCNILDSMPKLFLWLRFGFMNAGNPDGGKFRHLNRSDASLLRFVARFSLDLDVGRHFEVFSTIAVVSTTASFLTSLSKTSFGWYLYFICLSFSNREG